MKEIEPAIPCTLLPITLNNYFRVKDFREESRVLEYREKLTRKELGFFCQSNGRMVGSIWATMNDTDQPIVARMYMRLLPKEALIHDIVTGPQFRGMGVGPFMVEKTALQLLTVIGVTRIIVDVNVRNRPSLRMMGKMGLEMKERMLYVSALGRLVLQKPIRSA